MEKRERGRIQGLPKFFGYSLLSQERVKLRTSNLESTFTGPIQIKNHKNYGEKGAWAYPGAAQIFWVPPIISGRGKATDFKFCRNIYRVDRNKSPGKILGIVAVGVVRESRNFSLFTVPTYRAHCAVIFAIAQLSHKVPHWLYISKIARLRAARLLSCRLSKNTNFYISDLVPHFAEFLNNKQVRMYYQEGTLCTPVLIVRLYSTRIVRN